MITSDRRSDRVRTFGSWARQRRKHFGGHQLHLFGEDVWRHPAAVEQEDVPAEAQLVVDAADAFRDRYQHRIDYEFDIDEDLVDQTTSVSSSNPRSLMSRIKAAVG